MGRYTFGGQGSMWAYRLYDKNVDDTKEPPVITTPIKLTLVGEKADISLFSQLDGAGLIATSPTMDSDTPTITFNTDRKDKFTNLFFQNNCLATTAEAQKTEYENNTFSSVSAGSDLSKKFLVIWASSDKLYAGAGLEAKEYVAAVGYWAKSSKNWSTSANTKNTFTWTFNCEKASDEEIALIKTIVSSASPDAENGYGGTTDTSWGAVQTGLTNPFADWNTAEAIQLLMQ